MSKDIFLYPNQVPHVESLISILKRSHVAFDMSMMGAGKTYVASEVASRFGFKNVVIVCPASVTGKWESMKIYKDLFTEKFIVLSYESLRSTKSSLNLGGPRLLSHGLLYRKDPNPFETVGSKSEDFDLQTEASKLPSIPGGKLIKSRPQGKSPTEGPNDSRPMAEEEVLRTEFFPSDELTKMIKEGCLFIFDEAQKIKNKSAQWLATRCIANTLLSIGGKSRFLLLSGTPIDKEEHAINLMQMMGFIKSVKLFDTVSETGSSSKASGPGSSSKASKAGPTYATQVVKSSERSLKTVKLIGTKELIQFCMSINEKAKATTEKIVRLLNGANNFGLGDKFSIREGVIHLCYRLFQEVIKKEITASMAPPDLSEKGIVLDIKNGYYKFEKFAITKDRKEIFKESDLEVRKRELMKSLDLLNRMMKVGRFGPTTGGGRGAAEEYINKFGLTKPLKMIETAKVPLFIRKAYETLTSIPNSKVCIFVNYLDNLDEIANALSGFGPIIMNGSVDKKKRQELINMFQEQNLKHRLYISILSVSASGIDLDDQSPGGLYPRYAFASPGFKIDELHQLTRRFYRANTQSSTTFRFVYAKGFEEVGLLNNLARKTNVMKETLEKQVAGGVKFPGEYMNESE